MTVVVYAASSGDYSAYSVDRVFTSEGDAERYVAHCNRDDAYPKAFVERFELHDSLPLEPVPHLRVNFTVYSPKQREVLRAEPYLRSDADMDKAPEVETLEFLGVDGPDGVDVHTRIWGPLKVDWSYQVTVEGFDFDEVRAAVDARRAHLTANGESIHARVAATELPGREPGDVSGLWLDLDDQVVDYWDDDS